MWMSLALTHSYGAVWCLNPPILYNVHVAQQSHITGSPKLEIIMEFWVRKLNSQFMMSLKLMGSVENTEVLEFWLLISDLWQRKNCVVLGLNGCVKFTEVHTTFQCGNGFFSNKLRNYNIKTMPCKRTKNLILLVLELAKLSTLPGCLVTSGSFSFYLPKNSNFLNSNSPFVFGPHVRKYIWLNSLKRKRKT